MNFKQAIAITAVMGIAITACTDASENKSVASSPDTTQMPADNTQPLAIDTAGMMNDTNHIATVKTDPNKKMRKGAVSIKTYEVNKKDKMEADAGGVYPYAEVMPSFPGGERALGKWLNDNITYPEEALENDIQGDVTVTFAVDEMGNVYTPQVTGTKIGHGLEEEAMNVVKKMPKWNPGRIKGKNVKTKFTLPVSFQLQ